MSRYQGNTPYPGIVIYKFQWINLLIFMQNDSPNGIVIDTACFGFGAMSGALINQLIYQKTIPLAIDYLNGFMIVALLVVIVILAFQKFNGLGFGPRLYALLTGLVGWGVGTFIVVERHTK